MRLVCISDTHGEHEAVDLPEGDVLVHAGDITAHGAEQDLHRFLEWFASRSFAHHIFIAGNHDNWLEDESELTTASAAEVGVCWLNDSGCQIGGVSFWGSPITPRFNEWAFMRDPGIDIERHWAMIPASTDVLITHGPPFGILDQVERGLGMTEHTGCPSLLESVRRLKPALHLYGHIHEGYGERLKDGVRYINASTMNNRYRIQNSPVVIDLPSGG
ncbi:MAG: metallophosphatase domain-containing protein [Granulosicoccus sp.]